MKHYKTLSQRRRFMSFIEVLFAEKYFSVYFKVDYPPKMEICSVCRRKMQTTGITIEAEEIIDSDSQIPMERNDPFWDDIRLAALRQYKHELKVAQAVAIIYENYPDEKPTEEEISKILRDLRFVCHECEEREEEKKRRLIEIIEKEKEVIYEPQNQL